MEPAGLVGGIDYLHKNLRSMMRPHKRHIAIHTSTAPRNAQAS